MLAAGGRSSQALAWRWLGVGSLSWAAFGVAEAVTSGSPDILNLSARLGAIVFGACAFAAVLSIVLRQANEREMQLESMIMGVVLLGAAFEFFIDPVHEGPIRTVVSQVGLGLTLPIAAIGLVRARRRQERIALFSGGIAAFAPGWSTGEGASRVARFGADRIVVIGWSVGFLLLAAGAVYAWRRRDDSLLASYRVQVAGRSRGISVSSIAVTFQLAISYHAITKPGINYPVASLMVISTVLIAIRLNSATRMAERLTERTKERNRLHAAVDSSAAIAGSSDLSTLLQHVGGAVGRVLDRTMVEVVFQPPAEPGVLQLIGPVDGANLGAFELHAAIASRGESEAASRTPFVIQLSDAWLPSELSTHWRERGKWNALVIPMVSEHQLLGHVQVWSAFDTSEFLPEAVKTATAVVQEGSLAIQNARLLAFTRKRGNERALLLRVSRAASSSLELPVVLTEIAQATLGVAAIESTSVELWDPATDELVIGAFETIPEWPGIHPIGTRLKLDRWPLNRDALQGRDPVPFSVESPELQGESRALMETLEVGSGVLFPLLAGDERLGLLKIFSRSTSAFGVDEIRLGAEMSHQTALAIQNARLLEEERRRAEERAALLRVSRAATSSLDLYTVLGEIAESTIGVAGIECAAIELWHPATDELEIGAQKTIPEWPDVDAPGTRYPIGYWEQDREMLASRDYVCISLSELALDDPRRERMVEAGTGTLLVYPIWAGDQCLGMLDFFSRSEGAFTESTQRLGVEIASQTALAIDNARLLEAERERATEWAVLHRVGRAAIEGLDRRSVLADVAQACLGIEGTECCTIFSWDKTTDEIVVEADVTVPDWPGTDEPGSRYPLLPGAAEHRAMRQRAPILVHSGDPELIPEDRAILVEYGIESLVIIPVWISHEATGIIYLSSRDPRAFGDTALRIGAEIASQAALAIRNAQLLDETRRYADEQSALLRVSRAVSNGRDLIEVMNEVALASLAIAGAECCEIELLQPGADETRMVAGQHLPGWVRGHTQMGKLLPLSEWPSTRGIIARQQPLILDFDSAEISEIERSRLFTTDQESALIVPMVVEDRCVGVMSCYARVRNAFTEDSMRLGIDLAGQAAIAIERARMQSALEEQANTDGLTLLLNHRAIQERLDEELARAHRNDSTVAVLMVDLNRFKYVNDTYGHQAGDVVLRSAAAALKSSVRAYDIVGRYGGDEFMVILPATDAVEAVIVADRIVENAAATDVMLGGRASMNLNLSVGLSVFPAQAATRQELIDAADRAMYQAKQRRRHTAVTGPLLLPSLAG